MTFRGLPVPSRICFSVACAIVVIVSITGCGGDQGDTSPSYPPVDPDTLILSVIDTLPHDTTAFTQGLEVHGDLIWESTGLFGESRLQKLSRSTGESLEEYPLPDSYFGEGITILGGYIIQLTWQSGIVFAWDLQDPSPLQYGTISGQGWGICHRGDTLITSDGTSLLRFRDRDDLSVLRTVMVTEGNSPQVYLNELEWALGEIFANQWGTERILRIDPVSGQVTGIVDCSGLLDESQYPGAEVLNGIAWDAQRNAFLITGKYWPYIFVVEFLQ